MGSLLDHGTGMEDCDLVAELAGGQTMTDIDSSLIPGNVIELGVDFRFCNGVKCCCRFIQDDEGCVLIKRTSNGDFLGPGAGDVGCYFLNRVAYSHFLDL